MKKVRTIMLSVAVATAIGAAMAASSKAPCSSLPQYYKIGDKFYPAGIEGHDYICQFDHFGDCTYYYDVAAGTFKPCRGGKIVWIR